MKQSSMSDGKIGSAGFTRLRRHAVDRISSTSLGIALGILSLPIPCAAQLAPPGEDGIARVGTVLLEQFVEGSFGALVTVVAGLVAIVSAAMGAYRAAMSCLIVAVGAFTLRTVVEIFFGPIF